MKEGIDCCWCRKRIEVTNPMIVYSYSRRRENYYYHLECWKESDDDIERILHNREPRRSETNVDETGSVSDRETQSVSTTDQERADETQGVNS